MDFEVGQHVFVPLVGIGQIDSRTEKQISGFALDVFNISYPRQDLCIKIKGVSSYSVPVNRAKDKIFLPANKKDLAEIFSIISQPSKSKEGIWSRKAKEYDEAFSSGNILSIARVFRDIRKNNIDPSLLSHSEREIYGEALKTLAVHMTFALDLPSLMAEEYLISIANGEIPIKIACETLLQGKDPPVKEKTEISLVSRPSARRGPRIPPVEMKLDENKIEFEKDGIRAAYDSAKEIFADRYNDLVVFAIGHLYKEEFREEAMKEFATARNIAVLSTGSLRIAARKYFDEHNKVELPSGVFSYPRRHWRNRTPSVAREIFAGQSLPSSETENIPPKLHSLNIVTLFNVNMITKETLDALTPERTLGEALDLISAWEKGQDSGLPEAKTQQITAEIKRSASQYAAFMK